MNKISYFCEEHDKIFKTEFDFKQHIYSPAHSQQCKIHGRSFKSPKALEQHLKSPIHSSYFSVKLNRAFNTPQKFKEHLYIPPPPVPSKGKWLIRSDFPKEKSFGYFKCYYCNKTWISAHSFKNYKQGCKKCDSLSFPIYLWLNESSNSQNNSSNLQGSHDKNRCQACKAGKCLEKK